MVTKRENSPTCELGFELRSRLNVSTSCPLPIMQINAPFSWWRQSDITEYIFVSTSCSHSLVFNNSIVTASPCYYGRSLYCSVSISVLLQSCRVAFDYRGGDCLISLNAVSYYRHSPIAVLSPLPEENHLHRMLALLLRPHSTAHRSK